MVSAAAPPFAHRRTVPAVPEPGPEVPADFFARPVARVAPELVGCALTVRPGEGAPLVGGVIVETERYEQSDPASHSHRGPTPRCRVMFGPPAHMYVYRSYGLHWCLNIVCEPEGRGAAVLVRALRPLWGLEQMRARRGGGARPLCAGPGMLAQALGIDGSYDGAPLGARVRVHRRAGGVPVARGPRIGIRRAADRPWRFGWAGSQHLSRPLPPT